MHAHGHDLIVSHDYGIFSNGRAASFLSRTYGTPYVSEIHHVPGYPRRAQWWEPIEQIIYRVYLTRVARGAAAIRVVNRSEVPTLLRRWGIPTSRILVLPSAYIDRSVFHPAKTSKEYALGFVGRLVANKNLRYVARVFEAVAARWPSARFVVVGEGPERGSFQGELARVGVLDNVTFMDWLETTQQLAQLYRGLNALVCPSLSEGGPRVCLEAMSCGTVVFATPVGVMPDTIEHGENGWLLPWDPDAGASLVLEALRNSDVLSAIGVAAAASTVHFEKSVVLGAYAATYRKLARKSVDD
jgi:glycosyltransferase involved in cell wall biosynthesis